MSNGCIAEKEKTCFKPLSPVEPNGIFLRLQHGVPAPLFDVYFCNNTSIELFDLHWGTGGFESSSYMEGYNNIGASGPPLMRLGPQSGVMLDQYDPAREGDLFVYYFLSFCEESSGPKKMLVFCLPKHSKPGIYLPGEVL